MTQYLDLLSTMKLLGSLKGVEVHGMVTKIIDRPTSLASSVNVDSSCVCIELDVLAISMPNYVEELAKYGINSQNGIFLVNGSIACYVNKGITIPDWYTCSGNINFGTKARGSFLTMFNFKKSGKDWSIVGSQISDIDMNKMSRELDVYNLIHQGYKYGNVTRPLEVTHLPRFNSFIADNIGALDAVLKQQAAFSSATQGMPQYQGAQEPQVEIPVSSNKPFVVKNRTKIKERPVVLDDLKSILEDSFSKKRAFADSLSAPRTYDAEGIPETSVFTMALIKQLCSSWSDKPGSLGSTGRAIIKEYIEKSISDAVLDLESFDNSIIKYLVDVFRTDILDYLLSGIVIDGKKQIKDIVKKLFGDTEVFYAGVFSIVAGIDMDKLTICANRCNKLKVSFSTILNTNPYALLLLCSYLNFSDVEHIAYCLGFSSSPELQNTRNVCTIHDYIMQGDNTGSTVYSVPTLLTKQIGVSLTQFRFNSVQSGKPYLTKATLLNLEKYFEVLKSVDRSYPRTGWTKNGFDMILKLSNQQIRDAIQDFIDSGLGVEFIIKDIHYCTTHSLLEKELFVAEKLYTLANQKTDKDATRIAELIEEYEKISGFKLEELQKEGVKLLENRVAILTGPAGSGKTTTVDCAVYVCRNYFGNDDNSVTIKFAAPTGRASKRLQEVVKSHDVGTLHTQFGLGMSGGEDAFGKPEDEESFMVCDEPDYWFLDEMAMSTLNLLHDVLDKIDERTAVFLSGDVDQLPPIGKGVPFKDMLCFLPCVRLNVTKRSAEGSEITLNSNYINNKSEQDNWTELVSKGDFRLAPCDDDSIATISSLICKLYLGKLTKNEESVLCRATAMEITDFKGVGTIGADDILVVSPIQKSNYSWGTYRLNLILHGIFNPRKPGDIEMTYKLSSQSQGTKFRIGDRLIHTDRNLYDMQWYSSYKGGELQKVWGNGISNGEMGKIVALLDSSDCTIYDQVDDKPRNYKERASIRDDNKYIEQNKYFLVVEYYDYMSESNYYILYRTYVDSNASTETDFAIGGYDLKYVRHGYALTTHKMQGSEGKLIVGALGTVNFQGFLNRNMLYTEVTRGKQFVMLLGSVSNNRNSQLSKARRVLAYEGTETTLGVIFQE